MKAAILWVASTLLALSSCQSLGDSKASVNPEAREKLFSTVAGLAGRWEGAAPDGSGGTTTFEVTSNSSVIRETMLIGTPNEMTNMYTLDGNDLVMVHYCAMGNQPRMRASSAGEGKIAFQFESVADLSAPDEVYMGEMTLVILDDNRIEQHWTAFKDGEVANEMKIEMKRVQ